MAKRSLLAHAEKLHALRVLFATRSFRRAATALGVTPSALSQSVAVLEAHLGESLAVRSNSGVVPTPWAEQILAAVGPALDTILAAGAPEQPALPPTRLRLGAYESIAVYAVPELLARLGAKHPSLRVAIRTGRSGLLVQMVRRGDLDMALVAENDATGRLEVEALASDHLALWASPVHAIFRDGVSRTTPYAGLAPGPDGLPSFYRRFVRAVGLAQRPFVECDSFEALRMMAVRNVAAAILPRRVALRVPGELREVPLEARAVEVGQHDLCLVSRRLGRGHVRAVLASELRALLGGR